MMLRDVRSQCKQKQMDREKVRRSGNRLEEKGVKNIGKNAEDQGIDGGQGGLEFPTIDLLFEDNQWQQIRATLKLESKTSS